MVIDVFNPPVSALKAEHSAPQCYLGVVELVKGYVGWLVCVYIVCIPYKT